MLNVSSVFLIFIFICGSTFDFRAGNWTLPNSHHKHIGNEPTRSIECTLQNMTDFKLIYQNPKMDHGIMNAGASIEINPRSEGRWSVESNGAATGVEGTAYYKVENTSLVVVYQQY